MFLFVAACAAKTPTPEAPADPAPPAPEVLAEPTPERLDDEVLRNAFPQAVGRARAAMATLGTTLKSALMAAMQEGGPVAALEVCAQDAESLTAGVAERSGVRVGRSSLKLRNPNNSPPLWVADWLQEQGERPADGVQSLAIVGEREDGTAVVRVVSPLAVEGPCLICHGPAAGRQAELAAVLAAKYPEDQATGYTLGDLRGAVWAETEVLDDASLELDPYE